MCTMFRRPLLAAVLAGCTGGGEAGPNSAITVTPKPANIRSLDVYAGSRNAPVYVGEKTVTIAAGSAFWGPVAGADCTLSSDLFSARFTTPADVTLPDYREKSPPATVRCSHGKKTGQLTLSPVNITALRREVYARRVGTGGGITVAIPLGPRDMPGDIWGYPSRIVVPLN